MLRYPVHFTPCLRIRDDFFRVPDPANFFYVIILHYLSLLYFFFFKLFRSSKFEW
jgi:hypothetical protein